MNERYTLPGGDLYILRGMVPEGLFRRVEQVGGIPGKGPGSKSIPNALERARLAEYPPTPTTKEQRTQWNANHRLNPFGR